MSDAEPGEPRPASHVPDGSGGGVAGRVLSLLLHPAEAWSVIAEEPATIEGLFRGWVLPLAAIPSVATAVGLLTFHSYILFGTRYQPSFVTVIADALVLYALTLVATYGLAVVIAQASARFGGDRSLVQAFKLTAYSGTAAWIFGLLVLLPMGGEFIALLGALYSLYTLYLGLPKLMRINPENHLTLFGLVVAVSVLMFVIITMMSHNAGDIGGPVQIY